jgi:CheY-like chemotaxis protein
VRNAVDMVKSPTTDRPPRVVLCVDDEQTPLILRKLVLEKAGYSVLTANSATEALEILSREPVDLLLSDQLMPGAVGTELARKVKAVYPQLPIIVLSGVNEIPADAGIADLFLSKVEGPEILCQKISWLLQVGTAQNRQSSPDL